MVAVKKIMELLGIIRNYFVGRNVRQLGVPPIMEMDSGQPVVILSETKDIGRGMAKEGFFAEDAQNDKQAGRHGGLPLRENAQNDKESVVILSETKDLGRGETKERFFAKDAQNDKQAGRHGSLPLRRDGGALPFTSFPSASLRGSLTSTIGHSPSLRSADLRPFTPFRFTTGIFDKEKAEDVRSFRTGRHYNPWSGMTMDGGLPLRENAQNDKESVVILSETKDIGRGKTEERFFAKDAQNDKIKTQNDKIAGRHRGLPLRENAQNDKTNAQNDKIAGRHGSLPLRQNAQNDKIAGDHGRSPLRREDRECRVQPRNPAYEGIIAARHGTARDRSLRASGCMVASTSSTTTWSPFSKEKAKGISALPLRVIVLILMLLVVGVRPVVGQVPPTRLFINPTPLLIDTAISPSGVVTLEVADGVDIFAFDLFVQYDPALLSVSQVTLGGFLGEGLFCMDQINTPGLVHYNCTRFGVDTGVSGSGVLLELTFEAFGQPGDTPLLLTGSELYNWPDAFLVDATLEDGAVSVRPFRTYLPLLFSAGGQW